MADLNEQLKKVSLHKTETKDTSAADIKQTFLQLEKNKAIQEATYVEKWAQDLKDVIIPSFLFSLTQSQAKAIQHNYEHLKLKKDTLTEADQKELDHLASVIEQYTKEQFPGALEQGFFVRLSSRSPKDATMFSPKMKKLVQEQVEAIEKQSGKKIERNTLLGIVYDTHLKCLAVHSGKEAVELLSSSIRIWQDIIATLDGTIGEFKLFVVLRKWMGISNSLEFRAFVYERKLTAISSYNRAVYWPQIQPHKEEIGKKLSKYWHEKILPKLSAHLQNFVIDFAFLNGKLDDIIVVELNPFYDFEGNATNAEMFDWQKDEKILKGTAPFEFRIVESPMPEEALKKTLTKPFRIWMGWETEDSFKHGIDWY